MTTTPRLIRVDQIEPNPDQPRKRFTEQSLDELAASIKENELIQPITVRMIWPDAQCAFGGDRYGPLARFQIVAGERRWRAHQRAGLEFIKANVHEEMSEEKMAVLAIIENLQRQDITPLEEARAFQRMLDQGYTVEELAKRLGIKQAFRISDRVQLLRLRPAYLDLFERSALTPSQAFELSRLDPAQQPALFEMIRTGRCETYNKLRAAADGIRSACAQDALFELPAPPTEEETAALTRFESLVERLVDLLHQGMRDNEIVVLRKINPARAGVVVQQFELIRQQLASMEKALQQRAAQGMLAAAA